jgi:hypothetical protein
MVSERIGDGVPLVGIGVVGFIHEFALSSKAELLPVALFALLMIKGIMKLTGKD